MSPSSFDWWAKESHRGTPVVIKMENPTYSMVELEGPDFVTSSGKDGRGKNAKQLTWVLLLKAHKAAGCLSWLGSAAFSLGAAVRRRVASGRTDSDTGNGVEDPTVRRRFYSCIKLFLLMSVFLLGFEIVAYFQGWHFGGPRLELQRLLPTPFGSLGLFDSMYSNWVLFRTEYLAPPLQFLANVCVVLFLIQSTDRLVLCLGCFWIRFRKIKPVPKQPIREDLESGDDGKSFFPMVLVQIPMCNEKEVLFDA